MEESLREQIMTAFPGKDVDIRTYSSLSLAFLGDAVYSMVIRTILMSKGNNKAGRLHDASGRYVCAAGQAAVAAAIAPLFTDEEAAVFRRGKNANPSHHAKNARISDYLQATALEALCGYLYLQDRTERMIELIRIGLEQTAPELIE